MSKKLTEKKIIIGETSQLSYYYPKEITKISARQPINESVYQECWDKVYLFFAEQRTYFSKNKEYKDLFYKVNFDLTMEIVKKIKSKKIIFLSTSELWNLENGPISIDTPWNYEENYYIDSKNKITKKLLEDERVLIHYPFNYNSIYRKDTFLFHKIFSSIITKTKIKIGNVNINRELLHAKFVYREIEKKHKHSIIGAGQLINIKKFILDLYKMNNLDYNDFVTEETEQSSGKAKEFYSSESIPYTIEERLREYTNDIQNSIS